MSASIASLPSSSSMYLMTDNRSTTNSSLSIVSKRSIPAKRAWEASSSSPAEVATIPKEVPKYSTKLDILFIPGLLDKIIQYAPNLALPRVNRKFRDTAFFSIPHVIYNVFMAPRHLPIPEAITEDLEKHKQTSIPGAINESANAGTRENSETKTPKNSTKDIALANEPIDKDPSKIATILKTTECASIWKVLGAQYYQMMEAEYWRRASLIKYSDYILQTIPHAILLQFKELPPFSIHWKEELFAQKQEELKLYMEAKIPSDFSDGIIAVLRQLSYFLSPDTSSGAIASLAPATSSNSTTTTSTVTTSSIQAVKVHTSASSSSSTTSLVPPFSKPVEETIAETAKLILRENTVEAQEALKLEVERRIAEDATFVSRLWRYIFDQIFDYMHDAPQNSQIDILYREGWYDVALPYLIYFDKHLTYEDLDYALFIHLHTVITRMDTSDENIILKPELINLIFYRRKAKALAKTDLKQYLAKKHVLPLQKRDSILTSELIASISNAASGRTLTDLRKRLEIFLSYSQYDALLAKIRLIRGTEIAMSVVKFDEHHVGSESRIDKVRETIRIQLPGFFEPPASFGCCCTIL